MQESEEEEQGRLSPSVPPRLIITTPDDDSGSRPTLARQRSKTVGSGSKTATKAWYGLEAPATPARRKRRATQSKSSPSNSRSRSSTESSFLPKLARILESGESSLVSRSGIKEQQSRRRRDRSPTRSRRSRDEAGIRRSPVKQHRVGSLHKRSETLPRFNPSLLSVLSSLTSASGHSSSSNTTITQLSYDRASQSGKSEGSRRESSRVSESESTTKSPAGPNVFDYLDAAMEDNHDSHSIYSSSSSSSHYQASDAGSSELPDTPSSHSTCPSPTATRSRSVSGSVAELRRKYDSQYASSVDSRSSGSQSPEADRSPPRSIKKLPQLRDVAESDEHDSDAGVSFNEVVYDARQRSSSHSYAAQLPPPPSQPRQHNEERLNAQQDALREHVAQDQQRNHHHRVDSAYGQHRSHSSSSTRSADSQRAWAQHVQGMQMQQYQQYASPAMPMAYPVPYHNINGHIAPPPPAAPDPPDNTIQTITGYELLAQELSNQDSPVKPIYRRFEYLNHRILLHMQDELQELEEQLRVADEIIARADPSPHPSSHTSDLNCPPSGPSSRRADRNHGTHWHHQRTELLGRIFLKTKDYNAAVSSFATMLRESSTAMKEDVDVYRSWMREKDVICEVERKFLDAKGGDLIGLSDGGAGEKQGKVVVGDKKKDAARSDDEDRSVLIAGVAFLPIIPLVLFSIISTLAGRMVVTLLLTLGAVLLTSSRSATSIKIAELLGLDQRQTHMAVAGCMLVCCAFAGCVPLQ